MLKEQEKQHQEKICVDIFQESTEVTQAKKVTRILSGQEICICEDPDVWRIVIVNKMIVEI